jgi:hypothetical protein
MEFDLDRMNAIAETCLQPAEARLQFAAYLHLGTSEPRIHFLSQLGEIGPQLGVLRACLIHPGHQILRGFLAQPILQLSRQSREIDMDSTLVRVRRSYCRPSDEPESLRRENGDFTAAPAYARQPRRVQRSSSGGLSQSA